MLLGGNKKSFQLFCQFIIIKDKQIFCFWLQFYYTFLKFMNTSDIDATKFDLLKLTLGLSILSISIVGISWLNSSEPQQAIVGGKKVNESVGLQNLGNTCYMNSLLQALSGCPAYMSYVQSLAQNGLVEGDELLSEFFLILLQLKENDSEIDPANLYQMLCQDGEFTRMFEECDSHELNLFMQDKLISFVSKSVRKQVKKQGLIFEHSNLQLGSVLSESCESEPAKDHMNPMMSLHQINIQCEECSKEMQLHRHEYHLDINLDIPREPGAMLADLLANHFQGEVLDDYSCIKCALKEYLNKFTQDFVTWKSDDPEFLAALKFFHQIYQTPDIDEEEFKQKFKKFKQVTGNNSTHEFNRKKVKITKAKQVLKPPKTLVIHFNRLAYDGLGHQYLNKNFVQFPLELSLDNFSAFQFSTKYHLCSVIEHLGSPMLGHYISFKKSSGDDWIQCNDHLVSQVKVSEVLQTRAYMLFYEKY